jgi:predicted metal-dependent phosphotriesterase family hydrolase
MTVTGAVPPGKLGRTLPHEHVLTDFVGADRSGPHRYRREEVVEVMLPRLQEIAAQGVRSFVDCTPMYLGRDVRLLQELSRRTGLQILTNTGQYKEPFLPESTFRISAEELAQGWIGEMERGIDGTDVRPGFIKTAVPPGALAAVQRKVIEAAAITSGRTGLTIATHMEDGEPVEEILAVLEHRGVAPQRWILVHAHNLGSAAAMAQLAERGVWISLDGVRRESEREFLRLALDLLEAGAEKRLLLSQDAGWYNVGEERGGQQVPYTFLFAGFLPRLREAGVPEATLRHLTEANPGEAFALP